MGYIERLEGAPESCRICSRASDGNQVKSLVVVLHT